MHDKKECYTHKKFKTNIKSWISFEKVHRIVKFNQKAWLKSYIDMNTDLKKKHDFEKNHFEKDFFKLMNNAVFEKAMENVRKHRDNNCNNCNSCKTAGKRNYTVSEPNYHTTTFFF